MKKKLDQKTIVTANAIAFSGAAFFGIIAIFSAIASFTNGGWNFLSPIFESFVPGIGTGFFFALLGLACGLIAMFTIKKITDADRVKATYGVVSNVAKIATAVIATYVVSVVIYAILAAGAGGAIQKELWLNSFLPALIVAIVFAVVAYIAKFISKSNIKLLPTATMIVLAIAGVGALLTIISTITSLYGKTSYNNIDSWNDLFNSLY